MDGISISIFITGFYQLTCPPVLYSSGNSIHAVISLLAHHTSPRSAISSAHAACSNLDLERSSFLSFSRTSWKENVASLELPKQPPQRTSRFRVGEITKRSLKNGQNPRILQGGQKMSRLPSDSSRFMETDTLDILLTKKCSEHKSDQVHGTHATFIEAASACMWIDNVKNTNRNIHVIK